MVNARKFIPQKCTLIGFLIRLRTDLIFDRRTCAHKKQYRRGSKIETLSLDWDIGSVHLRLTIVKTTMASLWFPTMVANHG